MTLEAGRSLGPYQILGALGAGGMGEVYKARDTRLERTVAVKVLPAPLTADPELRARLEREAKALSSLNHPHICALYDVGQQDGVDFLVMEHIEGESLADRLARGPLSPEEVVRFGIQIAQALDKAHKHGVIHRDLKPGNVMLTKSGAKLLDFGLARADVPQARDASGNTALPTMERPLTAAGTMLGTFQYMAPEQLEGREADARTDIFALGALLHEMATAQKAFSGPTQASLIAAIMHEQPPSISTLQPMTSPALDRLVRACLAKDPDDRLQTAHDVALELKWIAEGGSQVGVPAPVATRRRRRERLAWAGFAVAAAAAVALAVGYLRRAPQPLPLVRFQVAPPEGLTFVGSPRLSPDGRFVAFDATSATGTTQLWLRPLDALEPRPVPGTEGAGRPFWSPDSRFLGFFAEGKLKKVDVAGGPPQTICDAPSGSDGAWSRDGVILFDGRANDPILRVPAGGGVAKPEVAGDANAGTTVGWPEFLPDGRHFLYVLDGPKDDDERLMLRALDSGEATEIVATGSRVQYAPPGYLLYVREDTLVAQAFDAKARKLTGEPVPVAEGLGTDAVGLAHFSASLNGVLTYRAGETQARQLVWYDRSGRELGAVGEPAEYGNLSLSPDGARLVVQQDDPNSGNPDLWIRDLARGVSSRFTFDPAADVAPIWSPDGREVVFSSARKGAGELYRKPASGASEEQEIFASGEVLSPAGWSRDGRYIVFNSRNTETGWDIWALPTSGGEKAFPLVKTRFGDVRPSLSPEGRFIAYQSNESGRAEVYVQEFPEPQGKWQVSTAGGAEPQWSASGKEIFYLAPDQKLMAVPVQTTGGFAAGMPAPLFDAKLHPIVQRGRYAPAADGQRFLLLAPVGRDSILPTTVVQGWTSAVRN